MPDPHAPLTFGLPAQVECALAQMEPPPEWQPALDPEAKALQWSVMDRDARVSAFMAALQTRLTAELTQRMLHGDGLVVSGAEEIQIIEPVGGTAPWTTIKPEPFRKPSEIRAGGYTLRSLASTPSPSTSKPPEKKPPEIRPTTY